MTHPIVTDETLKKARDAYADHPYPTHSAVRMRAALEAVAGDIAKQVGEEIASRQEQGMHADCRDGIHLACTACFAIRETARVAREIGAGNGE